MRRIEMNEAVVAGEIGAQLIRKIDVGDVVAAAGRHGEIGRDVERIGQVDAEILVDGVDAHRRRIAVGDGAGRILRRIDDADWTAARAAAN